MLHAETEAAYAALCAGVAHLRPQTARQYCQALHPEMAHLDQHPGRSILIPELLKLAALNWAATRPFLNAVRGLPQDHTAVHQWASLVHQLCACDIDVGIAFLESTPQALTHLGMSQIQLWGATALAAIQANKHLWKAASAYLRIASDGKSMCSLKRWEFFLQQAGRIADVSPAAAEAFVLTGQRACLLLTEEETRQWVSAGLAVQAKESELITFFGATSSKAMETRDQLTSGEPLRDHLGTLALMCEALAGRRINIRSNTGLVGIKGFTGGAATDGNCIFLPEVVKQFGLYKLMALHQTMLLGRRQFLMEAGRASFDPVDLHLYADKRLIQHLPGLAAEMRRQFSENLPETYPMQPGRPLTTPLPWWGDILPELIRDTAATAGNVQARASAQYEDVSPELIEMLLANLMAEGQRDSDALWQMLTQIMDEMDLSSPEAETLPDSVKTFFYKEWDQNLADYKLDWCLVRQKPVSEDPNGFVSDLCQRQHGLIMLIRKQFTRLKPEQFKKYRAQPYGDSLDLDALIEAVVDQRCGSVLSDNIYIRQDKRERDVAVLFLMDMSGSTEEQVNGQRIIDIQKEAMVLMAEALDALGDPYAILGFTSEGRFRVDVLQVKDFHETYSDAVRYRLGNLQPAGLTRMGAVIRHAIYKLENVPAAIRLMVILTDGRPYDLEYGNLDYAIADTRKAIQEARRTRIHPFIITSDAKSTDYLRRIAPQTQSIIVPRVELLPMVLPAIYKRLTL